jgi:hypothetical protein
MQLKKFFFFVDNDILLGYLYNELKSIFNGADEIENNGRLRAGF